MKQFTNLTIHSEISTFWNVKRGLAQKGQPNLKRITPQTRHAFHFKALQKGEWVIVLPFMILAFAKLSAFVASLLLPH